MVGRPANLPDTGRPVGRSPVVAALQKSGRFSFISELNLILTRRHVLVRIALRGTDLEVPRGRQVDQVWNVTPDRD